MLQSKHPRNDKRQASKIVRGEESCIDILFTKVPVDLVESKIWISRCL